MAVAVIYSCVPVLPLTWGCRCEPHPAGLCVEAAAPQVKCGCNLNPSLLEAQAVWTSLWLEVFAGSGICPGQQGSAPRCLFLPTSPALSSCHCLPSNPHFRCRGNLGLGGALRTVGSCGIRSHFELTSPSPLLSHLAEPRLPVECHP